MAKEPELITITKEELDALRKQNPKSETREIAEAIAVALIESKKPYVSPGEEENRRMAQEQMKRQGLSQRRQKKLEQESCPHIKGCNPLSDSQDIHNRSSFLRHRLDTGATFLMCTNCQKTIWQDDPEFNQWLNKPSGNRPSAAGDRYQTDPVEAMNLGRLPRS